MSDNIDTQVDNILADLGLSDETEKESRKSKTLSLTELVAAQDAAEMAFSEYVYDRAKSQYVFHVPNENRDVFNYKLYADDEDLPVDAVVGWWTAYVKKDYPNTLRSTQPAKPAPQPLHMSPPSTTELKRDYRTPQPVPASTPPKPASATVTQAPTVPSQPAQTPAPAPTFPILTPSQRIAQALKDLDAETRAKDAQIKALEKQVADLQAKLTEAQEEHTALALLKKLFGK